MVKKGPIPQALYDILCCPVCKKDLKYNRTKTALRCSTCDTAYPIKEGIPVLLPQQ